MQKKARKLHHNLDYIVYIGTFGFKLFILFGVEHYEQAFRYSSFLSF